VFAAFSEFVMKSDKVKLIAAVVIFVIAAVVIVIQLGVFGGSTNPPPVVKNPADPNAPLRGGPRMIQNSK
jgi:multisubunit Na+/H+ antiporter MnhC subunit